MSSLTEELKSDPEATRRFAKYAIKENPSMQNFSEFETALKRAFNTSQGKNALNFINDDESKLIFESDLIRKQIKDNVGKDEYEQVYGEAQDEYVQRRVAKGKRTKLSDIVVITIPRPVKVHGYKKGQQNVAGYSKGYKKWTPAQTKFLKSQKAKNISAREIVANYNKNFNEEQRSSSSLRTKIYRI
jgi:hypothetical protein